MIARAKTKRTLDKLGDVLAGNALHIRAEVLGAVVFKFSHYLDFGKVLFEIDFDKRIGFVVLEQNIVGRHVLFDEIVF